MKDDDAEFEEFAEEFERLLDEDPEAALEEALLWVKDDPQAAGAHYAAGLAYETLGNEREKVQSFVRVLELDGRDDGAPIRDCERIIAQEVEATLATLPPEFRERLGPVTTLVERRPSRDLVEDGFED